jgi:hypothetical protein
LVGRCRTLRSVMLSLWPVFLEWLVQEDSVRLFELDDVVTLPVNLVDVDTVEHWPEHLGVQTSVTFSEVDGWVTASDGLSCRSNLTGPTGESLAVRAALEVPMMTVGPFSFVTGTVRRIELASLAWPEVVDPVGPVTSTERWTLTQTPVVPVSFRHGRDPLNVWDCGVVVHLEVLMPRCRCRELGGLRDGEGLQYARRHLREVAVDIEAGTARYICPDTGTMWLRHRWKRRRSMEHIDLKLREPMVLSQQQLSPDMSTSQALPRIAELKQIPLEELTGSYRVVAQLHGDSKSDLEHAGIQLETAEPESTGPVRVAGVKLHNGSHYLVVEHLAHPERFIDVRAQTSAPSSKLAARQLLTAADVPDARVLWLLEHWWA